jgi:chromosome partitioning protein
MRRIAMVCLKGGSSKSTTTTALAVGLARRGHRTIVVDCDGQANATWTLLGGGAADAPTLAEVLTRHASADEAIRPTAVEGLDLLPASASLGGVNVALAQELGRDTRLRSALAPLDGRYDYQLFDTGPAFSTILANVLVTTSEVIVPLDPGVYAVLGLVELEGVIAEVKEAYGNDALRIAGLLLTKVSRNNVCRDIERGLRERFGPLVYRSTIPLSSKFEEAASRGTTILAHAPKSPGAVAYEAFIEEVIAHGRARAKERGRGVTRGGVGAGDAA